jgi:RNA polymerase sigma-70 factor (ECF subfamily)
VANLVGTGPSAPGPPSWGGFEKGGPAQTVTERAESATREGAQGVRIQAQSEKATRRAVTERLSMWMHVGSNATQRAGVELLPKRDDAPQSAAHSVLPDASAAERPSDVAPVEDDEALVLRLIAGEPGAAREVWIRFSPMVRRVLRRSFNAESDVDDIVQDVFAVLFEKIGRLRDPKAFRGFVLSVTLLEVRRELRRRYFRRRFGPEREAPANDVRVVHPDPEAREALLKLHGILGGINPRDRAAFTLRFVEGLELTQVSDAMGVSLSTTKRCLRRAWGRVRVRVERDPALVDYLREDID